MEGDGGEPGVFSPAGCGSAPRRAGVSTLSFLLGTAAVFVFLAAVFVAARSLGVSGVAGGSGIWAHTANILRNAFVGASGTSGRGPVTVVSREGSAGTSSPSPAATRGKKTYSAASATKSKKSTAEKVPANEEPGTAGNFTQSETPAAASSSEKTLEKKVAVPAGRQADQAATADSRAAKKKSAASEKPRCGFYSAASPNHLVVINEIAWMGSVQRAGESASAAGGNEWMELKNVSGQEVNLAGWRLMSRDGGIDILFDALKVGQEGLVLLERTDDTSVPGVKADVIYTGALSNSGEWLVLYDADCNKVDEVNASGGWMAGENATKKTMERAGDFSWHTSVKAGGTPRQENTGGPSASSGQGPSVNSGQGPSAGSAGSLQASSGRGFSAGSGQVGGSSGSSGQGGGDPSTGSGQSGGDAVIVVGGGTSASPPPVSPQSVSLSRLVLLITEIQTASPSSTHDEWVEIFNPQSDAVDLTGWYVQKKTRNASSSYSTFAPKTLLAGKFIAALGYFVVAHPSATTAFEAATGYGIADDNTLVVKNPDGDIVDKVGWGEAQDCAGTCAPNAAPGFSLARKYENGAYRAAGDNAADFEVVACKTPGAPNLSASSCVIVVAADAASFAPPGDGAPGGEASSTASEEETTSTLPVATSTEPVATSTPETPPPSSTVSVSHLVIAEVQTMGGAGAMERDFIKIFNPAAGAADVSGWKLRKRTQSGTESSIKVFPEGSAVQAGGYFVWANSGDDFASSLGANVSSTATVADDTSVALKDASGGIVDAVAWGSDLVSPFVEGNAFPQNPVAPQKLFRKTDPATGDVVDTDNNAADFELRS